MSNYPERRQLTVHSEPLPGGPLLWIGPFFILAAAATMLYVNWGELPDRVVVHWGISGPDRWAPKSWRSVFLVLLVGAWVQVLLVATALAIARSARSAARASGRPGIHRRMNLQLLCALGYVTALMMANISLTPAFGDRSNPPLSIWIFMAALILVIAGGILRAIRHAGEPDEDANAPKPDGWHWGIIYYSPEDPAVMVPRRSGLGYTLNFANRAAWLFVALGLGVPLMLLLAQ